MTEATDKGLKRIGALVVRVIDLAGSSRVVFQRSRCKDDWQVSSYDTDTSIWTVGAGGTFEDACHDFIDKLGPL